MIIQIGTEVDESRILWKRKESDDWKRADIDDLIRTFESVVRCKDCIYADPNEANVHWMTCELDKTPIFDDYFCGNGKRREKSEVEE